MIFIVIYIILLLAGVFLVYSGVKDVLSGPNTLRLILGVILLNLGPSLLAIVASF